MSNDPAEIDRAPVLVHYEIDIEAPLERSGDSIRMLPPGRSGRKK
jgi:hypothetical protein